MTLLCMERRKIGSAVNMTHNLICSLASLHQGFGNAFNANETAEDENSVLDSDPVINFKGNFPGRLVFNTGSWISNWTSVGLLRDFPAKESYINS